MCDRCRYEAQRCECCGHRRDVHQHGRGCMRWGCHCKAFNDGSRDLADLSKAGIVRTVKRSDPEAELDKG
jgi:hypothetical protein